MARGTAAASERAGFKIPHLRWWIVLLALFGTTTNYIARSALGSAAPTLVKSMHMSTQQYSYVVGAFQLAYTAVQPLAGILLDLLGTRIGLTVFAVAWSLANMAHALATGWPQLAVFRGLLGLSEGAVIPAGLKAVAEWFPDRERSVGFGWVNAGTSLGGMIAPPLVIGCILAGSWQIAFVITGVIGLVWALAWFLFYRTPQAHDLITPAELAYIEAGQEASDVKAPKGAIGRILVSRRFWATALPRFLAEPAWQTFNFWIPLYLATARGMNLKEIAMFAWLPFLAADAGSILGGYISPFLIRVTGIGVVQARKFTMLLGAVLMIAPASIGLAVNAYWAIGLFCIGGFAHQILSGALTTLSADLFPRDQVATANGMAGTVSWTGGLAFSLVVGALAATIGYDPLFMCLAIFDLAGAAVLFLLLRDVSSGQAGGRGLEPEAAK